jgi:hypothetical protein
MACKRLEYILAAGMGTIQFREQQAKRSSLCQSYLFSADVACCCMERTFEVGTHQGGLGLALYAKREAIYR